MAAVTQLLLGNSEEGGTQADVRERFQARDVCVVPVNHGVVNFRDNCCLVVVAEHSSVVGSIRLVSDLRVLEAVLVAR